MIRSLLLALLVVLRDGSVYSVTKPPQVKGRVALLTLEGGKVVSVPAANLDPERSAAANTTPKVEKPAGPDPLHPKITDAVAKSTTKPRLNIGEQDLFDMPRRGAQIRDLKDLPDDSSGGKAGKPSNEQEKGAPILYAESVQHEGINRIGSIWISGVVKNRGDSAACAVRITLIAHGDPEDVEELHGNMDWTGSTHTNPSEIPPHGQASFRGYVQAPPRVIRMTGADAKVGGFSKCR